MSNQRTRVVLKQAESIALADWLRAYTIKPGATYKTIARDASVDLKNDVINSNHVAGLMNALGLELLKVPTSVESRLAALERKLDVVIAEQVKLCREYGVPISQQLAELMVG